MINLISEDLGLEFVDVSHCFLGIFDVAAIGIGEHAAESYVNGLVKLCSELSFISFFFFLRNKTFIELISQLLILLMNLETLFT